MKSAEDNDVGPAVVLNAEGGSETAFGVIVVIAGVGAGVSPEGEPTARVRGKCVGQQGEWRFVKTDPGNNWSWNWPSCCIHLNGEI